MNGRRLVLRAVVAFMLLLALPAQVIVADTGTWATGVSIQNLSPDQEASLQMDIYSASGSVQATLTRSGIPSGGSAVVYLPGEATVPYGLFSSVISSNQPMAAVVNNVNRDLQAGDSYMGTGGSDLGTLVHAPLVFRNYGGYSTTIYLQNAHGSEQDLVLKLFPNGASAAAVTKTFQVAAYASATAELSLAEYSAFGETFGAATVEGTSGPAALAVTYLRDKGTGPAEMISGQYRGMAQESAAMELYAPLVFKDHGGWNSGINVVNTAADEALVTLTLTASQQSTHAGTTVTLSQTVAGNASANFYLPSYSEVPSPGFFGAAQITANRNILVIVNSVSYASAAGAVGSCYGASPASVASDAIAGPLVFRAHGDSDTGVNVQNLGTEETSVTMVFYQSGTANQWSFTNAIPGGGVSTFYLPTLLPAVTGVYGSAVLTSDDGSPILAIFNAPAYPRGLSANYVGINITN